MADFTPLNDDKKFLNILKESVIMKEQGVKIEVEHPGILEVPEGKNVEDLPISHFQKLIKKKGWEKISRALTNLHVWNKNKNPKLASWANKMQERLSKEQEKKEE